MTFICIDHLEGGTKLYSNNFFAVASTYPKYRERSGRIESVEFRVNECLQRSLDGKPIDSLSKEIRALVAYIKWTGKNVGKNLSRDGIKCKDVSFLQTAADRQRALLFTRQNVNHAMEIMDRV
jgi:thiosulfate dehydrogenase